MESIISQGSSEIVQTSNYNSVASAINFANSTEGFAKMVDDIELYEEEDYTLSNCIDIMSMTGSVVSDVTVSEV